VVAIAAAVVIKRVTSQLEKEVGKKIKKRSFDVGRSGSSASLREQSSPRMGSRNSFTSQTPSRDSTSSPSHSMFSPNLGMIRGKSPSTTFFSVASNSGDDDGTSNPWDKGGPVLPPGAPQMSPLGMTRRRISGSTLNTPTNGNRVSRGPSPGVSAVGTPRGPSPGVSSHGTPQGSRGVSPAFNMPSQKDFPSSVGNELDVGIGGRVGVGVSASALALAGKRESDSNMPSSSSVKFSLNLNSVDSTGDDLHGWGEEEEEEKPVTYDQDPALTSYLYDWSRKLFLSPALGYEPYSDPLSIEGCNRLFRDAKLNEVLRHRQKLADIFRYVDDKEDILLLDSKSKEDLQLAKATMVAALPSSVTKFEQKAVLNIDTAENTSLVSFHAYHDILAVSDGYGVGIWSLADGTRIMQIPNISRSRTVPITSNPSYRKLSMTSEKNILRSDSVGSDLLSRSPQGLGGIHPGIGSGFGGGIGIGTADGAGLSLGTGGIATAVAERGVRSGSDKGPNVPRPADPNQWKGRG
jgi:hypothetical protein